MSTESVMSSNHLNLSPSSSLALKLFQHQSFPKSQLFTSGGHSTGASASALSMNVQAGGIRETWIQVPVPQLLASPSLSSILCAVRMTAVPPLQAPVWEGPSPAPHPPGGSTPWQNTTRRPTCETQPGREALTLPSAFSVLPHKRLST